MAPTRYTKLADVHVIEGFNEDPGFIKSMREIAKNLKPDKNTCCCPVGMATRN